jgi:hypothetical protein
MRADGGLETVELWADTVAIDGDSGTCTISWRGRISADDSVVLAGLALADRTVAWGDLAASALARREATSEATQPASFGRQDSLGSVPAAWRRTPAQPPASDGESAARRREGTPWGPLGPMAGSGPSPWAGSLEDTWALGGPIAASTPPRTLTPEPWVPPIDSPAAPPTGADASPPPSPIEPSPVAPRATLPTKLGRDNATPDAVAGFLSAFDLPPRQS